MTRRAAAIAAAAAVVLLALVFAGRAAAKMPDFEVYWRAGARALVAEPLYRENDEHYQFKYLPAFAVLAVPLAALPLLPAKAAWFGLSAALIPLLIRWSLDLLPELRRRRWWLAGAAFLLNAKFYAHELVLGQVNLLFAVTVAAAVHLLVRRRSVGAGLLFALAVVVKPYAVIFLPWLAAQREWRATAAAAAAVLGALALPAVLYGMEGTVTLHAAWWQTVTSSTAPNLLNADNVSLAALFAKWLGAGRTAAVLAAAAAAVLLAVAAAVFLLRRHAPRPAGLEAAILLTSIPLLSPQGWDYVFLVATPATVYALNYSRELPPVLRAAVYTALVVAGFSLYDVMGRALYAQFMALSVVSLCFVVVIAALGSLRIRQVA